MVIARSFRALELYDVLGNLVPGAVFLIAIGFVFEIEQYAQIRFGVFEAVAFLIVSLVLGHIVQTFASKLDGTPTLFGDIVRASKGEKVDDLSLNITPVEAAFWPLMQQKFNLPDEFNDYGALFRLLMSYIETTPATRALRFQALHSFYRGMWAVWVLIGALAILGFVLDSCGVVSARQESILVLIIVGCSVGFIIFEERKEKFNKLFIQYAIADFYSDQKGGSPRVGKRGS